MSRLNRFRQRLGGASHGALVTSIVRAPSPQAPAGDGLTLRAVTLEVGPGEFVTTSHAPGRRA